MINNMTTLISSQYLFFTLNDEKYGLKTNDIKEIVDISNIRKVPNTNKCIKGVTNIRGEIIPVIDLKMRLKIGEVTENRRTSLIILNILDNLDGKKIPLAIMVDLVVEVEDILEINILETPVFGTKIEEKYIQNIVSFNDEYITLLEIDILLNIDELSSIE